MKAERPRRPWHQHFQTIGSISAIVNPFALRAADSGGADVVATMARLEREWTAEVCYCSTLRQCRVADVSGEPPRQVQRCDDQPAGNF